MDSEGITRKYVFWWERKRIYIYIYIYILKNSETIVICLLSSGIRNQGILFTKIYLYFSRKGPKLFPREALVTDRSLLAASWDCLRTACISHGHLHIFFHNSHTFPLNHMTVSAYLYERVLFREISDWCLGQGSICNTFVSMNQKLKKKLFWALARVSRN